jgi:hypothetical protein
VFLPLSVGLLLTGISFCLPAIRRKASWSDLAAVGRGRFVIGCLAILAIANFRLYGVNYFQYGKLYPTCQDVYGMETCKRVNPFSRREMLLVRRIAEQRPDVMPISKFIANYYSTFEDTAFGIVGFGALVPLAEHGELDRPRAILIIWALAFSSAIGFNRDFRRCSLTWAFFLPTAFYAANLFYQSWSEYIRLGIVTSVHARYFFPILIPVLFLAHRAIFVWKSPRYTRVMVILLAALYTCLGLNIQFGERHRAEFKQLFPRY